MKKILKGIKEIFKDKMMIAIVVLSILVFALGSVV